MQSRLVINLVLAITVVGLTFFLVKTGNHEPVVPEVRLTRMDPETVSTIRIFRRQSGEIEFKKENNVWMMTRPYAYTANPVRIHTMLGLLGAHSYAQYNFTNKKTDLSQYKLDTPDVSISFDETRIDFGDTSPLGNQRYVQLGQTVHLINDSLFQQLQTPATFFLSTLLLPYGMSITSIEFPDHTLTHEGATWTVAPAINEPSEENISQLINSWMQLEAISISVYEDSTTTFDTIKITMKNQEVLTFVVVSPPPQLILARTDLGIQYHFSGYDTERLFLPGDLSPAPVISD